MKGDGAALDEIMRIAEDEKNSSDSKLQDRLAARKRAQDERRLKQQKEFEEETETMDIVQLAEQEKAYDANLDA